MQELSSLRSEVDQIQKDFFNLVFRRFQVTAQIWRFKKIQQLPFTDQEREQELIHQFDDHFDNEVDRQAFQSVVKALITASKNSAGNKI